MRCQIPECSFAGVPDKHHIHPRSKGGSNRKWNLVTLCPNHHRDVHRGNLVIDGWVMTTNGRKLQYKENAG